MQTMQQRPALRPVPQIEDRRRLVTAVAIAAALEGAVVGLVGAVLFLVPNPRQPGAFVEAVLPATALVAFLFAAVAVAKHVRSAHA